MYILTVECLSRALSCKLSGYTTVHNVTLTHFLFADDLVTFHSSIEDFLVTQMLLNVYACGTGCMLNKDKCSTLCSSRCTITPPFKAVVDNERYLGFRFNSKGIVSQLPKILEDIISLLTKWCKACLFKYHLNRLPM